jgi:hypothetical protein
MTTLPLADGARLLGVHPKTLCQWFKQAQLPLVAHPADARIKCVSLEHLHQVAGWHGRPCPSSPVADAASSAGWVAQFPGRSEPASEGEEVSCPGSRSSPSPWNTEVLQKLSSLETRVATLQAHLADLALSLLSGREHVLEQRITALESLLQDLGGRPRTSPPGLPVEPERIHTPPGRRQPLPAELKARSRMPALIEYSPQGTYVLVSSQEGELHLTPDSPEWFEWLASLCSFRFVGKLGRFSACRDSDHGQHTRCWVAHRCLRGQRYKHYLGTTDHLTLASLEQMAARLQAEVAAVS